MDRAPRMERDVVRKAVGKRSIPRCNLLDPVSAGGRTMRMRRTIGKWLG